MKTTFFLFLLSWSCVFTAQAARPVVAVLEYRSGVSEQPDFSDRLAELLRAKSMAQVLSVQDCRRMLGAGMDAMVAQCKEDPACFAKLGRKLGASEVLFVGMTEFGTVLVNLSRFQVSPPQLVSSVDMDIQLGEALPKLRIYQLLRKLYPDDFFRRYGTLEVTSNQPGAAVRLDRRLVGQTPLNPLQLEAPRKYELNVVKPGFVPFSATVDLAPNARLRLDARLTPEGQASPGAWYTRWWVITLAVGAVAAGAAAVWWYNSPPSEVPATVVLP